MMFFIITIFITVVGFLILIAVIAFSTSKKNVSLEDRTAISEGVSYGFENNREFQSPMVKNNNYHSETRISGEKEYLPVLNIKLPVEKLKNELVYFKGKSIFFQVDTNKNLNEISNSEIIENKKEEHQKGDVYITSKWIVFVGNVVKKIALNSIENYRFIENFLIIKRKRVKNKKDIFEILENSSDFYYIMKVLLKK